MMKELYKRIKRPLFSVIAALSLWFIFPLTVLHLIPLLLGAFYFISFSPGRAYDRTVRVVSAVIAALFSSFTLLANLSNILVEDAFLFSLFRVIIGFWGIFLFYDAILRFFLSEGLQFFYHKKRKAK